MTRTGQHGPGAEQSHFRRFSGAAAPRPQQRAVRRPQRRYMAAQQPPGHRSRARRRPQLPRLFRRATHEPDRLESHGMRISTYLAQYAVSQVLPCRPPSPACFEVLQVDECARSARSARGTCSGPGRAHRVSRVPSRAYRSPARQRGQERRGSRERERETARARC